MHKQFLSADCKAISSSSPEDRINGLFVGHLGSHIQLTERKLFNSQCYKYIMQFALGHFMTLQKLNEVQSLRTYR